GRGLLLAGLSMRSVTVGTSTSAVFTASTSWAAVSGLSSVFSLVSNSSISRVSIASGSVRVTITSGFFFEPGGMPARLASPLVACPAGGGPLEGRNVRVFNNLSSIARKYCITASNANSAVVFPLGGLCCVDALRPFCPAAAGRWRPCRGPSIECPTQGLGPATAPLRIASLRRGQCSDRSRHPLPGRLGVQAQRHAGRDRRGIRELEENQGLAGGQRLGPSKPADRQEKLHHPCQARQPAQDAGRCGRSGGQARTGGNGRNSLLLRRLVSGQGVIQWRQRLAGTDRFVGRL